MSMNRRAFIKAGVGVSALALSGSLHAREGLNVHQSRREDASDYASAAEEPYLHPVIRVDEWREEPVRHRFVQGGFEGTELLFSLYFPPEEQYEGRFFQPLAAVSGAHNMAPMALFTASGVGFAVSSGGYLVESNQGSRDMFGGSSKANAAVARYSRSLAAEMYGPHRPFGYVYGGSGGAFKTKSCVENYPGVWDGSIPFVHGSPVAIPYAFTVQAHAMRILGPKFPQIIDAIDPGGSGDMYAGLNDEEREALQEVTRMGFPPRAWFDFERIAFGYTGVFSSLIDFIISGDPEYFEDFWTKPGYLGANPTQSLLDARIQRSTRIQGLIMADEAREMGLPLTMSGGQSGSGMRFPAALRLENLPDKDLRGASLMVKSGGAKDAVLYVAGRTDDIVMVGFGAGSFQALGALQVGDDIEIDNSVYLAAQTYHRHQDPGPEFTAWDQFRGPDGTPLYPQRPRPLDASVKRVGDEAAQSGEFDGKMMVVHALMDEAAYPWMADWYRARVEATQGARFDDKYRLYLVDHAMHTTRDYSLDNLHPATPTRVVSYQGVLQQALRDLTLWAEKGVAPPPSSRYRVREGQIVVPGTSLHRKGIQPVVNLTVNDGQRVEAKVGEQVTFRGEVELPQGTGKVVAAEWDFEGEGDYPVKSTISEPAERLVIEQTHAFSKPGTYFPALKVASARNGTSDSPYARPENLGRVRVIVS